MNTGGSLRALVVVCLISLAPPSVRAACVFDTDGDGSANLVVADDDGDGLCDWPEGTVTLPGTLTFAAGTSVQFRGTTAINADSIVVEEGARLVGNPTSLSKLTLTARRHGTSDIRSKGRLELGASDDIVLQATGSVDLDGETNLSAGDRVVIKASQGDVTILQRFSESDGAFDVSARNRVEISAKGANGNVNLATVRIASYKIIVSTRANVSSVGEKQLGVSGGSVLTTDRARTGLSNGSNIQLTATGPILITGDVVLDANTSVAFVTQRQQDGVCLSDGTTIEASNGLGSLYFTNVRGEVTDDGTTVFRGRILGGDRIVQGQCLRKIPCELSGFDSCSGECPVGQFCVPEVKGKSRECVCVANTLR